MATAAVSGKTGSVAGQTGGTEIVEWNATLTFDAIDATSMASAGWREFIGGLKGGTGTFVCIGTNPVVEEVATLTLKDEDSSPSYTLSGKAIINEVSPAVPVDDRVSYNVSFTFTGVITVA
jgi:predicted secreted protein